MTARAAFRQSDMTRCFRALKAAGVENARVIMSNGRIEVIVGNDDLPQDEDNPLERYLNGKKA